MRDVLMFVLAIILTVFVTKACLSDGTVDYCYCEDGSSNYVRSTDIELYGHRPWRFDRKVGGFKTHAEALQAAAAQNCPIR